MSLTHAQRAVAAEDFQAFLSASELSVPELARWLGLSPQSVGEVIVMSGTNSPVETWLVRDALEQVVSGMNVSVPTWRVLTDDSREKAVHWFTLRRVPPRPKG